MVKGGFAIKMKKCKILFMTAMVLLFIITSCRKDDIDIDIINHQPVLGSPEPHDMVMLMYKEENPGKYKVFEAGSSLGAMICSGEGIGRWYGVSGVQSGMNQYLVCHPNIESGMVEGKEFSIRKIEPGGYLGAETEHQTWNNNYENFFGFQLGIRGFIFGLDNSLFDKIWFTQEVYSDGTLAQDEAASGEWNNYYRYATPIYSNGQTFLFFHNDQTNYWFITHVYEDGTLHDVCDGHWADNWEHLTSVETSGNSYLFGMDDLSGDWFLQHMDHSGHLNEETDWGTWISSYKITVGYSLLGQAYLFGTKGNYVYNQHYFIQKITPQGAMGIETDNGEIEEPDFAVPFKIYEKPDSFRYTIGWNMRQTNGNPTSWSARHDGAWGGYFKMGGGAALANIDGDPGQMQDAVMMGIEDRHGADRFYYKIAWNLDIFGNPQSMSPTLYGPTIGELQAGAGADICDIDSNGDLDLIFMVVDDPAGPNAFWYYIGYNMNEQGIPTSWGPKRQVSGWGDLDQGGGAAIGLIDNNLRPDIVLIGIDNPWQDNNIWMVVGRNLDWSGLAQSWTQKIILPCDIGWSSAGGGAALADINNNGHIDVIIMNIDNPHGPNNLMSWVGWDIDIDGNVASWSAIGSPPSPGNITSGGGAAIGDIDLNGTPDLFLMTIDNPYGND